jgi:CubicO group peptidase (beta-lactamase class C family)
MGNERWNRVDRLLQSDTFMRRQIFQPLRMDNTTADSATDAIRRRAIFYFPRFAADPRYGPQAPSEVDIPASPDPPHSSPRRPTWCGSSWRSPAARC